MSTPFSVPVSVYTREAYPTGKQTSPLSLALSRLDLLRLTACATSQFARP